MRHRQALLFVWTKGSLCVGSEQHVCCIIAWSVISCFRMLLQPVTIRYLGMRPDRFLGASQNREKWLLISFIMSFRPSVRMEERGLHWTDIDVIWCLSFLRKSVSKVGVSVKSDKNEGLFTWRRMCVMIISRWIILKMRSVSDRSCRENQNTHFMFFFYFFLPVVS
jgi:hypothetical protein